MVCKINFCLQPTSVLLGLVLCGFFTWFFLTCFVTSNFNCHNFLIWKKIVCKTIQPHSAVMLTFFHEMHQSNLFYKNLFIKLSKLTMNCRWSVAEDSIFVCRKREEIWEESTFYLQSNYQDRRIQSWLNTGWVKSLEQKTTFVFVY